MPIDHKGLRRRIRVAHVAAGASGTYDLDVGNSAEYARHLQDREGFFVTDVEHLAETAKASVLEAVRELDSVSRPTITRALDAAGFQEVDYLRSLTTETTGDGRRAHPGHWADRSGLLANSYFHEVAER